MGIKTATLNGLHHRSQCFDIEFFRAIRKMFRRDIKRLRITNGRIVVMLVPIRLTALFQLRQWLIHQFRGLLFILHELVARREKYRNRVFLPRTWIFFVQRFAQCGQIRRGHRALPRQQIRGIRAGTHVVEIFCRARGQLLQERIALAHQIRWHRVAAFARFDQHVQRIHGCVLIRFHRRSPQAKSTFGILSRTQHTDRRRERLLCFGRAIFLRDIAEFRTLAQHHRRKCAAGNLFGTQMREAIEIGHQAIGNHQRQWRHRGLGFTIFSEHIAL